MRDSQKKRAGRKDRSPAIFPLLPPPSSLLTIFFLALFAVGCSFDYGNSDSEDSEAPDIIMNDVEYVRVRDGDPQVRFRAELAERYEDKQLMELRDFTFEQFEKHGDEINAFGSAASARVELESGNIGLSGGVSLAVESEDIIIETQSLDWQDKERQLSGSPNAPVRIYRDDGTNFEGRGFKADVRNRTWEFSGPIGGAYFHEDDEDEDEEAEDLADEVIDNAEDVP
ncbi:MAG: LPS export ABC transporter periplasmic protein LptC [Treponema sp.]|nr:LPS export ABC transporter periplasmic protein LptC [Treponema sp.]